jgi:hypothetical protein
MDNVQKVNDCVDIIKLQQLIEIPLMYDPEKQMCHDTRYMKWIDRL